jgi:L-lactate dehydrogenase (cytochrome)
MEMNMSWHDIAWVRKLAPGLPVVVKGVGAWEVSASMQSNGKTT